VPREEPTEAKRSRRSREDLETRPEDPEEVFARLQRQQRRRRAVIVVMSLAALMFGGAVLLDRGLVATPTSINSFGDMEVPEVPDLENTWVGKALKEAQQAREAEAQPRSVIRPLGGPESQAARTETTASAGPEVADGSGGHAAAMPTPEQPALPQGTPADRPAATPPVKTARAEQRPASSGARETARATSSRAGAAATGTAATGTAAAPSAPSASAQVEADPAGAQTTPPVENGAPALAGSATEASPLPEGPGVVGIAASDSETTEEEDAFYEDTQPDETPVDPEQFRPRRPWPVPPRPPPPGGRVGSFSVVTRPAAEVRFRDHPLGSTPLHSQQLPSGRQRLILVGPDGVRRVLILDIHADDHAEIQLPLSRLMPEALMP